MATEEFIRSSNYVPPTILVAPKDPNSGVVAPSGTGTGTSTGTRTGSGGTTMSAAQKEYEQRLRDQARADAQRYIDQAKTLKLQVDALRAALQKDGFKAALNQQLANVALNEGQQDAALMAVYNAQLKVLDEANLDNEVSASSETVANLTNKVRERTSAVMEAVAQGAGESDMLRAQQMALNNWNANQSEIHRAYKDTKTSLNSSLTDLNSSTYTNRVNNAIQANADRNQLWTNYYNQRSQTLTQLGNTLGDMAAAYSSASSYIDANDSFGKKMQTKADNWDNKADAIRTRSGNAFMRAADVAGKAYQDPGVSSSIRDWKGREAYSGKLGMSVLASRDTSAPIAKPEGATLRSWA